MDQNTRDLARIIAISDSPTWPTGATRAKAAGAVHGSLCVHFISCRGELVAEQSYPVAGFNGQRLVGVPCTFGEYQKVRAAMAAAPTPAQGPPAPPTDWAKPVERTPFNVEGYESLADVLQRAYDQSARGKGKERHATGLPFNEQPIVRGAKDYGPGGPLFQVGKKSREAFGMLQRDQPDAAVRELLGAIVYAAAAIVAIEGPGE